MKLSGKQVESLHKALLDAFALDELRRMVRTKLDENLDAIASGSNLSNTLFELIGWAERQGKLSKLITGAAQANPGNQELQAWIAANMAEVSWDSGLESARSVVQSEPIDKLEEKFASFEAKTELVNALLACPTVRERHTRDSIVGNLPDNIRNSITRNSSDQVDVMNVVSRVLDFSGGLATLLTRVRFYEGGSDPMQKVDRLVG